MEGRRTPSHTHTVVRGTHAPGRRGVGHVGRGEVHRPTPTRAGAGVGVVGWRETQHAGSVQAGGSWAGAAIDSRPLRPNWVPTAGWGGAGRVGRGCGRRVGYVGRGRH